MNMRNIAATLFVALLIALIISGIAATPLLPAAIVVVSIYLATKVMKTKITLKR